MKARVEANINVLEELDVYVLGGFVESAQNDCVVEGFVLDAVDGALVACSSSGGGHCDAEEGCHHNDSENKRNLLHGDFLRMIEEF